jgi:hypothetical protein
MTRSRCSDTPAGGKGCGAPIVWVPTRSGKTMPLDETDALRRILIESSRITFEELRERLVSEHLTPHWATCPNAATHRRRKLWRHLPR